MNPTELAIVMFLIAAVYTIFVHDLLRSTYHALRKKRFNCLRCGACCRLKVRLYPEDIAKLKAAGKKNFLEPKGNWLKRTPDGYCMFYKRDNSKGIGICTVNHIKPSVCKNFPFYKTFGLPHADLRCNFFNRRKR